MIYIFLFHQQFFNNENYNQPLLRAKKNKGQAENLKECVREFGSYPFKNDIQPMHFITSNIIACYYM